MWVLWYRYLSGIGGEGIYKTKAAKAEARIAQYQLQDGEKRSNCKLPLLLSKGSQQKTQMATKNMEKADENLRYATLGFKEGVIMISNVLEATTAWLSAQSEKIDAQIDVKLNGDLSEEVFGNAEIMDN